MKKAMKTFWSDLIEAKDFVMVRIYALIHIRKYREKVVSGVMVFLAALVLFLEYEHIAHGGKLSLFALLAAVMFAVMGIAALIGFIKDRKENK